MMRVLVAAAAALLAVPAAAQDIEVLSELSGRPLPQGYYDRIRQDPHFFQWQRGWRGMAGVALEGGPGEPPVGRDTVRGEPRMVVMLGLFADSGEPSVPAAQVHERLFGDNPLGNLTQFYQELSGGMLTIRGAVLPWVRTGVTRAEAVGKSYGLGSDGNLGWFMVQTLTRLDATTNFGQFDNDGPDNVPNSGDDDGYVDLAVFQFAETAASCGRDDSVWPHAGALRRMLAGPFATDDRAPSGKPILVDEYHMQSAVDCEGTPQTIGTIAHETGHAFGLPDLYDASGGLLPAQRRWVLGCWTLMAAGSWGCGDGASFGRNVRPSHMGPWEKGIMGWIRLVHAERGWRVPYALDPVQASRQALLVPLRGTAEYLLLEYRPNTGFDADLPAGGVLVYHIDTALGLRQPCVGCLPLYYVSLVEADGDNALRRMASEGGNRGVAGDVFAGHRILDDHSTPGIRLNTGLPSNVQVEIDVRDGKAHFVVSMLPILPTAPLVAPVLGSAGRALTADERAALDRFGNRNGGYDLGDLRAYMRAFPGTIVP
jgi:M6 family metalloprotease-like protein